MLTLENDTSTNQNPETRVTQHLRPQSEGIPRRYSDSSISNGGQSPQSHLAPQIGAVHKLSDTAAPRSTLSAPSVDGHLHLPSPPGSPLLQHRRFVCDPSHCKCVKNNNLRIQTRDL